MADVNGDGLSDLIVYSNGELKLKLNTGTDFQEKSLLSNNAVDGNHVLDCNGDGLLDILVTIPGKENSFIAFFKNHGNGTFKRNVKSFTGEYEWSAPYFINNNGLPSLFTVGDFIYNKENPSYGTLIGGLVTIWNWDSGFKVTPYSVNQDTPYALDLPPRDIDGDGKMEFPAFIPRSDGGAEKSGIFRFAVDKVNTAPKKMKVPGLVLDKSIGMLRAEWEAGSDAENATGDLSYEFEISSDGEYLYRTDTKSLFGLAAAGVWGKNSVSARVRAIDACGMKGEWSDYAQLNDISQLATFVIDKKTVSTCDTVFMSSLNGQNFTLRGKPDGTIVTSDDGRQGIMFDTFGRKQIEGLCSDGLTYALDVEVLPIRIENVAPSFMCGAFFDYFQEGRLLDMTYKGLYVYNKEAKYSYNDGKFEKLPVFGLSDGVSNDVDGDGYMDYVMSDKILKNMGNRTFEEQALGQLRPVYIDFDLDGKLDYQSSNRMEFTISNNGSPVTFENLQPQKYISGKSDFVDFVDVDNDGVPDRVYGEINLIKQKCINTPPTAPTTVYANQKNGEFVISWSGVTDKESTNAQLLYNISIRKKGETGDGSYIWSPLNANDDNAKMARTGIRTYYRQATTLPVPISRFEAGKTTDDGEVRNDGTIVWNTPGLKTVQAVSAASSQVQSTVYIMIYEQPSLEVNVPGKVLAGQTIVVDMPKCFGNEDAKVSVSADNAEVSYDANNNQAIVSIHEDVAYCSLKLSYSDEVWSSAVKKNYDVEVVGAGWQPQLAQVVVANGHNVLEWNAGQTLPDASIFTGKVNIYRETNVADSYELIGEVELGAGKYVDSDSRAEVKNYHYMITLPTVYGVESAPSRVHSSVHLMVDKGMGNDINLHWTPYEGADIAQYVIFAGATPENMQVVEILSGYSRSFVHRRTSDDATYYAIGMKLKSEVMNSRAKRAVAKQENIMSNVICSKEAYAVKLVTNIEIQTEETDATISETQTTIHLKALVTPVLATIANVEWSVVEGTEFATIDKNGVFTAKMGNKAGSVVVQAKAIDGSEVVAKRTFTVPKATEVSTVTDDVSAATIISGYGNIFVKNATGLIMITTANGAVVHRSVVDGERKVYLPAGIYIVKIDSLVKKVVVR